MRTTTEAVLSIEIVITNRTKLLIQWMEMHFQTLRQTRLLRKRDGG